MKILILTFLILTITPLMIISLNHSKKDIDELAAIFEKWALNLHNKAEKKIFDAAIDQFTLKDEPQPVSLNKLPPEKETAACTLCKVSLQALFNSYKNKSATLEQTYDAGTRLCQLIFAFKEDICRAYMNINLETILYIVDKDPTVDASSFCGMIYQSSDPSACPLDDERFDFKIYIPPYQPTWRKQKDCLSNLPPIKLLHLSDVHVDPLYEAGGVAFCGDPLCCRKGQNVSAGSTVAGFWGDYGVCDTPSWAYEDVMDHIKDNEEDIAVVYYTGDTVDHAIYDSSYKSVEDELTYATNKFKKTFPNKKVYPCPGNHDSHPQNAYAPNSVINPRFSSDWLFELLIKLWSDWLPASTFKTIRRGGFYTTLVKPGLRIIALNNNVAYIYNWWLVLNPKDPNGQLQWLCDTLLEAERKGEWVHIISHIPTGTNDLSWKWAENFNKIVDRFSHIITAQFNGHSHRDEFKIFYDMNTNKPTQAVFNGGAVTSYYFYNPNYKIYSLHPYTYAVQNYDCFSYNLTEANLTPNRRPRWSKSYSFKELYGVNSMSPIDLDKLVNKFVTTDKALLRQYVDLTGKRGDVDLAVANGQRNAIGAQYDLMFLCEIVTRNLRDQKRCNLLKAIYGAS